VVRGGVVMSAAPSRGVRRCVCVSDGGRVLISAVVWPPGMWQGGNMLC
jgi:hypothetical protein